MIKTITIPLNPKHSYEFPTRQCLVCGELERKEATVVNAGAAWLCDRCKNTLLKLIKENEDKEEPYYRALSEAIQLEQLDNIIGRKKGEWQITDAYPHNVYCSECHKKFAQTHWAVWEDGSLPRNFCPNCGADMREES